MYFIDHCLRAPGLACWNMYLKFEFCYIVCRNWNSDYFDVNFELSSVMIGCNYGAL